MSLEHVYAPWRLQYIANADSNSECFICDALNGSDDKKSLVVFRHDDVAVMLNRYPYNNGHVMIVPYEHVSTLAELNESTLKRLILLVKKTEGILRSVYSPDGFNVGINIGSAAGAGLKDHIHIHMMPRWLGDTNFMTTAGNVRVIPEDLNISYSKLAEKFLTLGQND